MILFLMYLLHHTTSNANNVLLPDPGPNTNVLDAPAGSDNRPATTPIVTPNGIAKPHGQNYINVPARLPKLNNVNFISVNYHYY